MDRDAFNDALLDFLQSAPTPYHAVRHMARRLDSEGFVRLREQDRWALTEGGRYYVVRGDSSLAAFTWQPRRWHEGWRLVGAHTDSPALKIKPSPDRFQHGCRQWLVEVYGGVLQNPWFDRDLGIAGRVTVAQDGELHNVLIDTGRPVAMIPSLAIHLDREVNTQRSINAQEHLPLVLGPAENAGPDFRDWLVEQVAEADSGLADATVLDYDLLAYDTQPPAVLGEADNMIAGARLDNLLSCFAGMQALLDAEADSGLQGLICSDHEEVGSGSHPGARGNFLESLLERLLPDAEERARCLDRSLLISTDNAHAVHPNYADRHEPNHRPRMNGGPVIKINANQSYATSSETAAYFRWLCGEQDVPVQNFVVRSDMGCGSTIGPLTATRLGVRTLDVGVPTLGMHSIRELAGTDDGHALYRVLTACYNFEGALPEQP